MKLKSYDILIIGADVAGIAFASSRSNKILLVDRTMLCGHDFTVTYKVNRLKTPDNPSPMTTEFHNELKLRNLADDNGLISTPAVSGVLSERLLSSNAEVMFMTEITEIKYIDDSYSVKLYSPDGFETIIASVIYDFTATGVLHNKAVEVKIERYFTAMLTKADPNIPDVNLPRGRFTNEYIVQLPLNDSDDYISARKMLYNFWEIHRQTDLTGYELTASAPEFMYVFPGLNGYHVAVSENWYWHPSAAYNDLISAFEGGVRL